MPSSSASAQPWTRWWRGSRPMAGGGPMSAITPPDLQDSELSVEGRVAVLTLNRHDVRNELTGTRLAAEIAQVAEWINREERVSVLVLTGAGSAFSAGGNVKHMLERGSGSFGGD